METCTEQLLHTIFLLVLLQLTENPIDLPSAASGNTTNLLGKPSAVKYNQWQQLVWLLCDNESRADFPHLIHATGLVGHVALPPPMDR